MRREVVMRLLVVSDDSSLTETLSGLCSWWGYEVLIAQQPALAFSTALEARPDIVVLDLGTHELDGCGIALRMRRQRQLEDTFLIAATERALEEDRARIEGAGLDAYLVKPLDFQLLKCLLKRRPHPAPRPRLVPLHPVDPDRRRLL
jgi:DNA-binding response OmpR family regulator